MADTYHVSTRGDSLGWTELANRVFYSPQSVTLGQGGFGVVKALAESSDSGEDTDMSVYAFKFSTGGTVENRIKLCSDWGEEYNIHARVWDAWGGRGGILRVPEPIAFNDDLAGTCFIVMDRICSPYSKGKLVPGVLNPAVHVLMGELSSMEDRGARGMMMGREQLRRFLDLEACSREMGEFLAVIHFELDMDGSDLEFILGTKCGNGEGIGVYVIDYGMVKSFDIGRASWAIQAVPYFPTGDACNPAFFDNGGACTAEQLNEDETLSTVFWNAYTSHAESLGRLQDALAVREESVF